MQNNTLIVQLDQETFDKIISYGIDIRKFVLKPVAQVKEMTETEYLMSTKANRNALKESLDNIRNRKNLVKVALEDL